MLDFPAVGVSGAFTVARARVLWREGTMRIYTRAGLLTELETKEPVLDTTKFWKRWYVTTPRGGLTFKNKCPTCGGWQKIAGIPASELWERGQNVRFNL